MASQKKKSPEKIYKKKRNDSENLTNIEQIFAKK